MSSNGALQFAYSYLTSTCPIIINGTSYQSLFSTVLSLLESTSLVSAIVGLLSSVKISLIVSIGFAQALQPILAVLNFVDEALIFILFGITVQSALMLFISATFGILLSVGIVLRAFYPTRKLGGAIMAIAIALFTVFPLSYLLDAQMTYSYNTYSNYAISNYTNSLNSLSTSGSDFLNNTLSSYAGASTTNSLLHLPISPIVSATTFLFSVVDNAKEMMASMTYVISELIVEVLFFPAFSLTLTIISIRELARLLGSEITFDRFNMI
ncbi:MAG: hypothetical protein M1504_03120 [Candidatus Marsarchaeota archaeon]|nr:hypothetical protein [Candidatus Marsarchaeota archaeon]